MKWSKGIFGANIGLIRKAENNMAMRPHKINQITFFFITLLACCLAYGDDHQEIFTSSETIMIPLIEKDMTSNVAMPVRGDNKNTVENEYGSPFNMHKAKGKPPISRWDYELFSVYFESDVVIHSALRR